MTKYNAINAFLKNKDGEWISPYTADTLKKNQITNCLLEVPQNIKLELKDGVLTLKAGSKVIVPNGFEADGTTPKFDYVTIENDVIRTGAVTTTGTSMTYLSSLGALTVLTTSDSLVNHHFSGATAPTSTTYMTWYDTANNLVKTTSDKGATWNSGVSLPLGIVSYSADSAGFTSIDQIFNGMGYIGSTVWLDKGVKGLIPNGRNEDGTLNNIEKTSDVITIVNTVSTGSWLVWSALSGTPYRNAAATTFYYQDEQPVVKSTYCAWYSPRENLFRVTNDKGVTWTQLEYCLVLEYSNENTIVKTFNPKLPFRAMDYNDKSEISGWSMPSNKYIDLTLGATGTTYTAPANGYFTLRGNALSASLAQVALWKTDGGFGSRSYSYTATAQPWVYLPVKKGEVVSISVYNLENIMLRFYYAEGEV